MTEQKNRMICFDCGTEEPENNRLTFFEVIVRDPQTNPGWFIALCDPCLKKTYETMKPKVEEASVSQPEPAEKGLRGTLGVVPDPQVESPPLGSEPLKIDHKDIARGELEALRSRIQNIGFEVQYATLRACDAIGMALSAIGQVEKRPTT